MLVKFQCRVYGLAVPHLRVEVHSLQEGASNGWKMYRNVYNIVIIFCDSDDFSDFKGAAKLSFIYAMYQVYIDSGDNEESCQILDRFAVSVGIAEMGIVTLPAAPRKISCGQGQRQVLKSAMANSGDHVGPNGIRAYHRTTYRPVNAEKMAIVFLQYGGTCHWDQEDDVWRCYDQNV